MGWRLSLALALVLVLAAPVWAGQNVLSWTDNSSNEDNFNLERTTAANVALCAGATAFVPLAAVGSNVVTFTDTAVVEGATYCYRVNASNAAGVSAFSNTAAKTVPFTVPLPPSNLR